MHKHILLMVSLSLIYYHISGLATTNILRLTYGNTKTILSSECSCDSCNKKISAFLQFPIISYILCKGRCKNCGVKIPLFPLFLELLLFAFMNIISILFHFSFIGISCSFLFYEIVRIVTIIIKGKRETGFKKQYIIAVFSMIPFYLSALFVALLYKIV